MVKMRCSDGVHNSAHYAWRLHKRHSKELKNGRPETYHIRRTDTCFSQNINNILQIMILHKQY